GDAGAGEIVDGDGIGAAQGVERDALDLVEVHGYAGDVAGEARMGAVGRDVDLLGDVGAVEEQRVEAVAAVDGVAAVARVPDERVVAGTQQGDVIALAAPHEVVAGGADDHVIAGAAFQVEADQTGGEPAGIDDVIAAAPLNREEVVGVGVVDRHLRGQAADDDQLTGIRHGDYVGSGGAVEDDVIGLSVAGGAA